MVGEGVHGGNVARADEPDPYLAQQQPPVWVARERCESGLPRCRVSEVAAHAGVGHAIDLAAYERDKQHVEIGAAERAVGREVGRRGVVPPPFDRLSTSLRAG